MSTKKILDKIVQYPKAEIKNAIEASLNGIEIALTSAQIQGMNATPIEIVTGVAGVAYEVTDWTAIYDAGASAYSGGGNIVIEDDAGTDRSEVLAGATLLTTTDAVVKTDGNAGTLKVGSGLYITNLTGAFGIGDGVMRIKLNYKAHVTGL